MCSVHQSVPSRDQSLVYTGCLVNVCGAVSKILQARENVLVIAGLTAIEFILISSLYRNRNRSRNKGAKSMGILVDPSGRAANWYELHPGPHCV